MNIKIYDSISRIKKEDWDPLTVNNVFMCYEWLKTMEDTSGYPINPLYIAVFDREKLLAASVCYIQKRIDNVQSIDSLLLGKLQTFGVMKKFSFLPAVICNPKRGYGTHFIFSNELQQDKILEFQNKLIDEVEVIADKEKASVCFFNMMEKESTLIKTLCRRGYYKTACAPLNYMDISWGSFNEYRKSLDRNHPRMSRKVSNEINRNKKSGVTIGQMQNLNGSEQRLFELLEINYGKYNKGKLSLKPDYIGRAKENFGHNAVVYAAVKKGEIIGVNLELRKGTEAFIPNIGIDHGRAGNDLTYFNLAFYEPVKNAIDRNVKRIYGGNSLYKTKGKRGYKVARTFLFYKPANRASDLIVRLWFVIHRILMVKKLSYIKEIQDRL
ncbi:MAG TPA: peptidogalycan biosysnthesis protein [Ignavibacteriaceae bacterium]|nr:peptidogalycan biosysnthesis protein [Ignavibacteriaceae bacterium]